MTKNNNVEATRSGELNGVFKRPTKVFMQHTLRNGVAPRHLKGDVAIPWKSAFFLFCMNKNGRPKCFSYANPQFGDQVDGITIQCVKKNYDFILLTRIN